MRPDVLSSLFDEWAASLVRGEGPDPQRYLEQAGDRADELARLMEAFLQAAPRPEPEQETVELMQALAAGESPLVALRARRGLRREDVVDAVMTGFALAPEKRSIVKRYVHRLEAGLLDPRRLSAPLLALLAKTLAVPAETITAARMRPLHAAPAYRLSAPAAAMDSALLARRAPEEDDEEVASLFLSNH